MGLFRGESEEKPDIEFITKTSIKKIKFDKSNVVGDSHNNIPINIYGLTTRHLLELNFIDGIEGYIVTTSRPNLSVNNHILYTWDNMYVEFHNMDMGSHIHEWLLSFHGRTNSGFGYKKEMTLSILDPTGTVIEKWYMEGCFPIEMTHQQDTYGNNTTIGVNFSIDRVTFNN